MGNPSAKGLLHFLQQVPDPRGREGQRHPHVAMLAATVCATLCGFKGYTGIAQWLKQPLKQWHAFGGKRKPPCENSFRDLLMKLWPQRFEQALARWISEDFGMSIGDEELQRLVFDGKALRGTRSRHTRAMMVLASHATRVTSDPLFDNSASKNSAAVRWSRHRLRSTWRPVACYRRWPSIRRPTKRRPRWRC